MEESLQWLYDYVLQFLRSPGWRVPILSFIDEHCIIFDSEDQNKLAYMEVFNSFKDTIDIILENLCAEIEISNEQFVQVVSLGYNNQEHRRIFEQILACDNFISFKKLMIKRNKQLEQQALMELNNQGLASETEVQAASIYREEAELQAAIEMSRAAQEEDAKRRQAQEDQQLRRAIEESEKEYQDEMRKNNAESQVLEKERRDKIEAKEEKMRQAKAKQEEEERLAKSRLEQEQRRAAELIAEKKAKFNQQVSAEVFKPEPLSKPKESLIGDLPPVQVKKNFNADALQVDQEGEELSKKAQEIASKNQAEAQVAQSGESLEERQARLRRQRELILEKKKAERKEKMEEYISLGGKDLSQRQPLPPIVAPEELERRRNIANRLKQMSETDQ